MRSAGGRFDAPAAVMVSAPFAGLASFALLKWVNFGTDPDVNARGGTAELGIWQYLVSINVMIWVLLAGLGLVLLRQLTAEVDDWKPASRGETVRFVVFVLILTAVPLVIGGAAGMKNPYTIEGQNWKIPLLHAVAGVANVPLLVLLKRIHLVAVDDERWSTTARDIARLQLLRRTTRIATAALGGVIALAVVATGALRQATAAAGLTPLPEGFVVVYGASFTAVVAAVYLYVFSALETRGSRFLEAVAALPDPSVERAAAFTAGRSLRTELSQELELNRDPRKDLQSLLAVLSPLIGALLTKLGGL
ncbi:hypothetical protein OHB24_07865 [Kribbella sp. NBC_00482]|uniref:hypothetical protein n=1 Tax=Kribbella sp. NBC_00482 TaxID=2975968 RepID=UPI002E1962D2